MALGSQAFIWTLLAALGCALQLNEQAQQSNPEQLERLKQLMEPEAEVRKECGELIDAGDAGFTWCASVMPKETPKAQFGVDSSTGLHGISFGIGERDKWSEIMSNRFDIYGRLYDCYYQGKRGPMSQNLTAMALFGERDTCHHTYDGICYSRNYVKEKVCLGSRNELLKIGNGTKNAHGEGRKFINLKVALAKCAESSSLVKIDIDGYEWDILMELLGDHPMMRQLRSIDIVANLGNNVSLAQKSKSQGMKTKDKLNILAALTTTYAPLGMKAMTATDTDGPGLGVYTLSFVNRKMLPGYHPTVWAR